MVEYKYDAWGKPLTGFPTGILANKLGQRPYPTGELNSRFRAPNGDERVFGPDGRVSQDIDHSHPQHHPDLDDPHKHDWEWPEDGGAPTRGPAYNFDLGRVIGVAALVIVGGVASAILLVDNATGIGVIDDFTLVPVGGMITKGTSMMLGG